MTEPYDPPGILFCDAASGREMKYVTSGAFEGWICYRHPDGQWTLLREATMGDLMRITAEREEEADG